MEGTFPSPWRTCRLWLGRPSRPERLLRAAAERSPGPEAEMAAAWPQLAKTGPTLASFTGASSSLSLESRGPDIVFRRSRKCRASGVASPS